MQMKSMLTAAILAVNLPLMAQQTITCSSTRTGSRFCAADTKNGVMLLKERSNNVCEQGSTWTYTKRGITVNGGCSADFQVGGNGGSDNGSDSYGNNSYSNHQSGNANSPDAGGNNPNANGNNSNGQYRNNSQYGNNRNDQNSANGNAYPNNNQQGYRNNGDGNRRQGGTVIPVGTQIDVRLEQRVNAAEVTQGEIVPATLVNDLLVDGQVVAPSGTAVQAKVTSAQGAALDVRLDSMTISGQRYALRTNSVHSARDSQAGQSNQSTAQGIGSILGSIAGGAQLPSGSVYTFRLTSAATAGPANQ